MADPEETSETLGEWTPCPKCGGTNLRCDGAMPLCDEHGNSSVRLSFFCTKCGHTWHGLFDVKRRTEAFFGRPVV